MSQSEKQGNTTAANSKRSNTAIMAVLVAVLVVLATIAGYYIGHNSGESAANTPAPTAPETAANETAPGKDQQAGQQAGQQPGQQPQPKNEGLARPRVTNPDQVRAMATQILRKDGDQRAVGRVDAPVVMVEYGDFSCPLCGRHTLMVEPKLKKYIDNGTLRMEWRDLSFFRDHNSHLAAAGGVAAAKQGKFYQYKHAAYEQSARGGHPDWTDQLVRQTAQKAGVPDLDKFMKDYKDPASLRQVDKETTAAQQLGINSTPFFIINDRFISGAQDFNVFAATIEAAAQTAKAAK